MTKVILHGIECAFDAVDTIEVYKVAPTLFNGDWIWLNMRGDSGSRSIRVERNTLLDFAYTIIDEFEEDEPEETPQSYVEVVE